MQEVKRQSKRIGTAIVGGLVVVLGIVAIPYPGPGWLIVFGGLAILATEFTWAQRLLDKARGFYDAWGAWLKRQPFVIRLAVLGLTGLVIIATLWLLNMFGLFDKLFHLGWSWLHSPLGWFK